MHNKHLVKIFSSLLIATIAIISCNKKDVFPNPNPVTKKIWKIKYNEIDSILFTYTASGQLHKVISTSQVGGNPNLTYTFLYDNANRVTEIKGAGGKHKFAYENNRLKLTENYEGTKKVSENIFSYTGDKITTNTLFYRFINDNGISVYRPIFKTEYSYNNTGDVHTIINYHKQANGSQFYKYGEKVIEQYDNAKNPLAVLYYLNLVTIYDIQGSKNILTEKMYDAMGNIEETTVNTYQYDDAKNPISAICTITPTGGTSFSAAIAYYYN